MFGGLSQIRATLMICVVKCCKVSQQGHSLRNGTFIYERGDIWFTKMFTVSIGDGKMLSVYEFCGRCVDGNTVRENVRLLLLHHSSTK